MSDQFAHVHKRPWSATCLSDESDVVNRVVVIKAFIQRKTHSYYSCTIYLETLSIFYYLVVILTPETISTVSN